MLISFNFSPQVVPHSPKTNRRSSSSDTVENSEKILLDKIKVKLGRVNSDNKFNNGSVRVNEIFISILRKIIRFEIRELYHNPLILTIIKSTIMGGLDLHNEISAFRHSQWSKFAVELIYKS
ncbi:hypothetical protein RF11_13314 [Thelohanellus kitauei]|uniref:Uncharacterized protein n=1 Tax=Thelohanellus kitauei TaxID=669202 RepID=A0A0C2NK28_THEKT|nr:hypothetical protein RF11_13314 [Thelohanellus kitauei]